MDTDSFVSSGNTKNIIKDSKNLEDIFDFSNLDENHEQFNNKIKKFWANSKWKLLKIFGLMNLFV